jgi:hypothetical protein
MWFQSARFGPRLPGNPTFYVVLSPRSKAAISALWGAFNLFKLVNKPCFPGQWLCESSLKLSMHEAQASYMQEASDFYIHEASGFLHARGLGLSI